MKRSIKFKVGDEVIIRAGKYKGKTSVVKKIVKKGEEFYLVCTGINIKTKHVRPNPQKGIQGGRESIEHPLHASNVAIYNAEEKSMDKIIVKKEDNQNKRYYKKTGKEISPKVKEKK